MEESFKNASEQTLSPAGGEVEDFEKYKRLMFKVQEQEIEKLWGKFEERNFQPILIKGWRAAQYYPKPFLRSVGDIDLAVNPEYYEKAVELKNKLDAGEVDLHRGLKYLDKTEWENIFANSIFLPCGGTQIRVLRPEDDLRVLCTHWLIDGGAEREKLWDIYYALENRTADFDWDRFLDAAGERRRKWMICAVGITHKYLGLDIEKTPVAAEAKNLPRWITDTIEKEWKSDVKFKYLQASLTDAGEFFRQVRKRLPPNPIQATVEMEGDFDDKPRFVYQTANIFYRLLPSIKRFSKSMFPNFFNSKNSNLKK